MTYSEFKKIGRFGCANCYQAFKKNILPLLKRIHGSVQHLGKIPPKTARETKVMEEIKSLKLRLEKNIELEDYEGAARLRDQIKEIEQKNNRKKDKQGK